MKSNFSLILGLLILISSCKKDKAQNGLMGHWHIESPKSGEMFLNDQGEGTIVVLNDQQDTLFYRDIYNFEVIDHSSDPDFSNGQRTHWYQAYMNDEIYCDFKSVTEGDIVNEFTPRIIFNIGSVIDNNTGQAIEVFDLVLQLARN